ncbi:MAG TPA: GNAT family N-acetyltransferase [Ignavibacteria bacterium]|nr:GNAT family N-acetyltransferase [Ignavibacteria bacterium]
MIELVKYSLKHKKELVRLLNNKNIEKWLLQVPFPYTSEDADFWINRCNVAENENTDYSFAIENDGKMTGGIGLHKKFEHSAEVGYWIGEEYWGKGYATEALNKILDIGFNELNFSRIHAHVFEGNIASEKLLLKCGFEYEGFLKKCHKKGNEYFNSKLFAKVI